MADNTLTSFAGARSGVSAASPALLSRAGLFTTTDSGALLAARLTLALVLWPHGAQKALGLFGGYGFSGTLGFFTGTVHLPYLLGVLIILIEFVGPLLLLLGLLTRPVALAIIGLMTGIILTSHLANGFFMNWFGSQPGEGYEYHLLMIGLALTLLLGGGGKAALDRRWAR